MGRPIRTDIAGYVYHVLNRANARSTIFSSKEEYQDFEKILFEAIEKFKMRVIAYVLMPNHFHLVLYPEYDGEIKKFMHWLTLTHTQRWHAKTNTVGHGHLYQGRYKSFIVEKNEYLWALLTYVERNPVRAKLIKSFKDWEWSSYYIRNYGPEKYKKLLSSDSITWPVDYEKLLIQQEAEGGLTEIRNSINRGRPYGTDFWVDDILEKFGLQSTENSRGRPIKGS